MDLKLLQGQMTTCLKEMEVLEGKVAEAEKAKDAKAIEDAKALYKGKAEEFENFKGKVDLAKAHQRRVTLMNEVTDLASNEVQGKVVVLDTVAGTARDHAREENELEGLFKDYFCGKNLDRFSDTARTALAPKGNWKGVEGNGVAIPQSIARQMMPEAFTVGKGIKLGYKGKALPSTSGGTAGEGNLFQPDFQPTVLQYPGEPPAIFPRTFKIPCQRGQVLWPQLVQKAPGAEGTADEFAEEGYVAAYWTAEGAELPGTEAQFKQQSITTFELGARTELSRQLIGRSFTNVEDLLSTLFRRSLLHKIDLAIINGDGLTKPLGILQMAGLQTVNRLNANQVTYDDYVKLEHAVAPQLRADGAYVIQDKALQNTKLQKDSQNRPLFIPLTSGAGTMTPSNMGTINSYPVVPTQRLPALGTQGDVLYGNWGSYICAVEQEVVIARSTERKIEQNVIVYVVFMQIGGKPVEVRAFSALN